VLQLIWNHLSCANYFQCCTVAQEVAVVEESVYLGSLIHSTLRETIIIITPMFNTAVIMARPLQEFAQFSTAV